MMAMNCTAEQHRAVRRTGARHGIRVGRLVHLPGPGGPILGADRSDPTHGIQPGGDRPVSRRGQHDVLDAVRRQFVDEFRGRSGGELLNGVRQFLVYRRQRDDLVLPDGEPIATAYDVFEPVAHAAAHDKHPSCG